MKYILKCPYCGLEHEIDYNGRVLLDNTEKAFALQCADSFSNRGCKEVIIIMNQSTLNKIKNEK